MSYNLYAHAEHTTHTQTQSFRREQWLDEYRLFFQCLCRMGYILYNSVNLYSMTIEEEE